MKTKVLHVLGGLSPGGVETLLLNIAKNIDKNKFQIDIVVHHSNQNVFYPILKQLGCNIFECPPYTFKNHFKYIKWWVNFFSTNKDYKIIHGHNTSIASNYFKIAKKFGLKTVSHIHSVSYGTGIKGKVKKITSRKVKKYADAMLGCSTEANLFLYGKKLVEYDKCKVIKNGIDIPSFMFNQKKRKLVRSRLGIDNETLLLGTVGRIIPLKNPFFIVDFIREIAHFNNSIKFLWVGNGIDKNAVISKINKLNLDNNFIFVDSNNDVGDYLSALDAFIFPSIKEGLGIALIEAQTNGLKCYASKAISKEAFITPLVKLLPTDNAYSAAELFKNFNSDYDRKNYLSMIKQHGYDIVDVTKELEKIYENLL